MTAWIVGGSGAAAAVVGLALIFDANAKQNAIFKGGSATGADIGNLASAGNTEFGVGIPLLSVGGAALVTGTILFLTSGEPDHPPGLSAAVIRGGGMAVWSGAW
jgi:hypothetical protein